MAYVKVGYHAGMGGNRTGIADYFSLLDNARIPFSIKSVNDVGLAVQAAWFAANSGVEHVIVLRWTNPGVPPGPQVPDYKKSPEDAAIEHWDLVRQSLENAPEFEPYKDHVWIETINEPRTAIDIDDPNYDNMHPSDWLGWFAHYVGELALIDGYKWLAFGMNTGTPEPDDWLLPGMVEYLKDCEANPSRLGVALHEYVLSLDSFESASDHLIGRFHYLFDACRQLGISPPSTVITELGWVYDNMSSLPLAMDDIRWMSELIAKYPTLLGANLWTLEGSTDLPDKLQKTIGPVTSLALSTTYPDPVPPPDGGLPSGVPREQYARVYWVYSPSASTSEREEIYKLAAKEQVTVGPSYDDAGIGALEDKTAVLWNIPESDTQIFLDWYDAYYPGTKIEFRYLTPPDPLEGLQLQAPFRVPFVLTSPFNAQRDYGLHEGADYDILSGESDSKEPVLACYDGTVIVSGTSSGAYAERVVVQSEYNGELFRLWYAHMDSRYVEVGDKVLTGQPIGELGGTGGDWAEHVHINLQHEASGLDGYVVPKVRDPHPFMNMTPQSGDYTGPPVSFVSGVDQPASDWYWGTAKQVFDITGLAPKFHTTGNSHQFYSSYKSNVFNLTRVVISPSFANPNPVAIWNEIAGDIAKWWPTGQRDYIFFNEPNIPEENLGKLWNNGTEFANTFVQLCDMAEQEFPGIRVWFPGMSPGIGDTPESKPQHDFIRDAVVARDRAYGVVCHSYSRRVDNMKLAAQDIIQEVLTFQTMWALDKPLVVGEFSVNRPASASYKAGAYRIIYDALRGVPGMQGAYSFTASWYGGQPHTEWSESWDLNMEGWLESGIHMEFVT